MNESVLMPALGESVSEATVIKWLKHPGDTVVEGEPLVEVSTDKVDTEVVSPYRGVLAKILVDEDVTVDVGTPIAIVGDFAFPGAPLTGVVPDDVATVAPAPELQRASSPSHEVRAESPRNAFGNEPGHRGEPYVTLLVRKAIRERHLDVSTLIGTGFGGRIRRADLPTGELPRTGPASTDFTGGASVSTMKMEWDVSAILRRNNAPGALDTRYASALSDGLRAVPGLSADAVTLLVSPDDGYLSAVPQLVTPAAAALCVGSPRRAPRVVLIEGQEALSVGWLVTATLAYDRRFLSLDDALDLFVAIRAALRLFS